MRLAEKCRDHANNQREKQPGRVEEDAAAARLMVVMTSWIKRPAIVDGLDAIGALHASALELVVENGIFVRESGRGWQHASINAPADVAHEALGKSYSQ